MMDKKSSRLRRALRARVKMRELGAIRLSIHRTPRHIYAQVIAADGDKVLAAASTIEKELRGEATGNIEAAKKVGALVAERAKARVAKWHLTVLVTSITVVLWCLPSSP